MFIKHIVYLSRCLNVCSIFLECPLSNSTFHKCFIFKYYFNDNMFYQYCKHVFQHVIKKRFENQTKRFKNQSPLKLLFKTFLTHHLDI